MKMHVIGEPDAVLGFLLIGLTGQVATTAAEVKEALETAAHDPEIGVILVTQKAASLVDEEMDALRLTGRGPAVVEIPGPEGSIKGRPSLHEVITRATGIRV